MCITDETIYNKTKRIYRCGSVSSGEANILEVTKYFCTHHVGGGTAALGGVAGAVGRGPVGVVVAVPHPELTLATITLVYHQVYRHLAFQT